MQDEVEALKSRIAVLEKELADAKRSGVSGYLATDEQIEAFFKECCKKTAAISRINTVYGLKHHCEKFIFKRFGENCYVYSARLYEMARKLGYRSYWPSEHISQARFNLSHKGL